ncbi:unnamed protein product [Prorocentrum cordatum]|uniref:Uncharacterized protein n=1 Tax=Prorocentrum cordatum TaxID=2364126 RepID=A0ABN9UC09_9DINO|nr:unnamed protein product [Polarella glacialis]
MLWLAQGDGRGRSGPESAHVDVLARESDTSTDGKTIEGKDTLDVEQQLGLAPAQTLPKNIEWTSESEANQGLDPQKFPDPIGKTFGMDGTDYFDISSDKDDIGEKALHDIS